MADFGENPDQGKFWNEEPGLSWVENDRLMSERLETISQLLLDNLDLRPSGRILDIGCGGGGTTLALAKRAPPSAQITGLDISKPLLDLAAQKCADHENINFVLADAQAHRFALQKFDTVISRFGVMFFENPVKARLQWGDISCRPLSMELGFKTGKTTGCNRRAHIGH